MFYTLWRFPIIIGNSQFTIHFFNRNFHEIDLNIPSIINSTSPPGRSAQVEPWAATCGRGCGRCATSDLGRWAMEGWVFDGAQWLIYVHLVGGDWNHGILWLSIYWGWNVIIPTDEVHHFFRGVGIPPTSHPIVIHPLVIQHCDGKNGFIADVPMCP